MDDLIYWLIEMLIGLFTDGKKPGQGRGPGYPNLPPPQQRRQPPPPMRLPPQSGPPLPRQSFPRPPLPQPQSPTPRQQEIRRRMEDLQRQSQPLTPMPLPPPVPETAPTALPTPQAPQPAVEQEIIVQAVSSTRPPATVTSAALQRWLRPNVLHRQFILTEIFQPPLALRDSRHLL
jgi:hypothetical protein